MSLSEHHKEEGGVDVQLVSRADNGNVVGPGPLEGEHVGEVRLLDPTTVICQPFSLETAEL